MTTPAELKYTKSHEWIKQEADGTVTVGITDFAQDELGDVVFVQHPAAGRKVKRGEDCAVVESVKAAIHLSRCAREAPRRMPPGRKAASTISALVSRLGLSYKRLLSIPPNGDD